MKKGVYERKWPTRILGPIYVQNHIITVSSTEGLHPKQKVALSYPGTSPLQYQIDHVETKEFEIKRVLDDTRLIVGPIGTSITQYSNPTEYHGGFLTMSEQDRNPIDTPWIARATYEEEPTVAVRTVLVDKLGEKIDSYKNPSDPMRNRLAVGVDWNESPLNLIAALMQIQMLGLPTDIYLRSNDGFFITTNNGTLIKAG